MINFRPFIGENYNNSLFGFRVLFLGESHYGDKEDNHPNFTNEVVNLHAYSNNRDFFDQISKYIVLSEDELNHEEKINAWKNIAFYNYVQFLVGEDASYRPTKQMWTESYEPFLELIDEIKPDLIVVLGSTLWDKIPSLPDKYKNITWTWTYHPSARNGLGRSCEENFPRIKEALKETKEKLNPQ